MAQQKAPASPVSVTNAAIVGGVVGAAGMGAAVAAAKLARGHSAAPRAERWSCDEAKEQLR